MKLINDRKPSSSTDRHIEIFDKNNWKLLRKDAPLKEIADVLRHRSLDTSMIYTKADLRRLEAVALPWPRGQL